MMQILFVLNIKFNHNTIPTFPDTLLDIEMSAYITVQKISINNKKNNPSILKKWQQEH